MACVCLLDGTDVMTTAEYSQWRDELCRQEDVDSLFDTLRRHLAKRLLLPNFRQLAVAGDNGMMGSGSLWGNSCLTAIKRQYVEADGVATCIDLLQAAERGDAQHVIELLEKPYDPNAADRNRHFTPLLYASANGHQAVVQCLLDAGADKEKADNDGITPLHLAARHGHQAVVECLLAAGADQEKADDDCTTWLLEAGADKDEANNAGATALRFAAEQGHQAVVQCLVDAGATRAGAPT
ncbi:unnamed protein product [Effrenium voratum]|uniref:Uncharacterized protein n=1 Tax=Effrenium voratum TaxID=2562239 RepID=A0AA36HTI8_9DINO|nr:unnamed protein product [Effrenium voratum]